MKEEEEKKTWTRKRTGEKETEKEVEKKQEKGR